MLTRHNPASSKNAITILQAWLNKARTFLEHQNLSNVAVLFPVQSSELN